MLESGREETGAGPRTGVAISFVFPEKDKKAEAWSRTEMSQWTSELGFDPRSL